MKKYFLFILFPLLLNSCKNNSEVEKSETEIVAKSSEKIDELQWLLGTWINQNGEEFSQETWSQESPSSFTAFSFTQVGKETVFAETMALEQKADSLLLTVATAKPEQEKPVTFKLISSENGQFTFENKNHDFPQRIIYTKPAKDSLHAWIEGTLNGEAKKVDFSFSRKN
ncbi:DUF6265 family protein [Aequorivita nionensis]|uniref:DUF6265 family protein n=1 Tax=Aequorivita nionensis TaxID=1287690 RepID=UPI003965D576